jgi:hypothetical protein
MLDTIVRATFLRPDARKEIQEPRLWEWFEYLYNEIRKREQKLKRPKA